MSTKTTERFENFSNLLTELSDEVDNKSISTYDANVYYNYGNVVYYEGKVYRHIKVSSGGTPGVKGQVPTNTEYWKEVTVSDLFKELSNATSILSSLTLNDFDYSGGPTMLGASPYTVNKSLEAIAGVLKKLNSNLVKSGIWNAVNNFGCYATFSNNVWGACNAVIWIPHHTNLTYSLIEVSALGDGNLSTNVTNKCTIDATTRSQYITIVCSDTSVAHKYASIIFRAS